MSADKSVSFKAILVLPDLEPEIRRFSIFESEINYSYLKRKLTTIYPSLKETPFTISWKDREGDQVQIWSDEELVIAVTEMDGEFKKLYIMPGQSYSRQQPGQTYFHQQPSQSFRHQQPDAQTDKAMHYGVVCDACDKDIVGFRYKCAFCRNYDLCQDCEAKKIHSEHYMIRISTPIKPDMEFGKKMMREFFKFNRHAMKADRGCKRNSFHAKRSGGNEYADLSQPSCSSSSRNQPEPCNISLLDFGLPVNVEGIIESVMQGLLRMAGGDTDNVPTQGNAQTEQAQAQAPSEVNNVAPTTRSVDPQSVVNTQEVKSNENVPSPFISKPSTSETDPDIIDNTWTILNKTNGNGQKQASNSAQNVNDVVMLDENSQPEAPQASPQPVQQSSDVSMESKVEESLNRMLAMGFNNEGDFLRQVLTAKNGSIEKVLDMLLPSRKSA